MKRIVLHLNLPEGEAYDLPDEVTITTAWVARGVVPLIRMGLDAERRIDAELDAIIKNAPAGGEGEL